MTARVASCLPEGSTTSGAEMNVTHINPRDWAPKSPRPVLTGRGAQTDFQHEGCDAGDDRREASTPSVRRRPRAARNSGQTRLTVDQTTPRPLKRSRLLLCSGAAVSGCSRIPARYGMCYFGGLRFARKPRPRGVPTCISDTGHRCCWLKDVDMQYQYNKIATSGWPPRLVAWSASQRDVQLLAQIQFNTPQRSQYLPMTSCFLRHLPPGR